jgi:mycothiol synthase
VTPDVRSRLTAAEVAEVRHLVHAVKAADGVPPLSDHILASLTDEAVHVLTRDGTALTGYAHLHHDGAGELAVHPAHRKHGLGRALVGSLLEHAHGPMRLWARGENPGAARLAESMGFTSARVLLQMRRPLSDVPAFELPAGVDVRTFEVGADEQAWVEVNNRAFASHPEQGGWTVADVRKREQEHWFDARGFFLAHRGPDLVGFHWTKVEDGLGEVYVVGVDPSQQGTGLGRSLTLLGLHHLASLGLAEVLLYVDESNTGAVALYEKLGFTTRSKDVSWSR